MRFNTMLTEQAFLCKDGKSGEMFADLTIGYDPCTEQVFAEVKDEVGKLHRVLAGKVRKGEWNDVRVNAVHDKQRHESTLTLTVKNEPTGKTESTSATYPGYALRYDVTSWVVGHGFPGNSPNSLQVRRGDIKGLAVSDSPTGPFFPVHKAGEKPIVTDDMTDSHRPNADIDPTVLIDDDGQAYIAWGNGDCYMASPFTPQSTSSRAAGIYSITMARICSTASLVATVAVKCASRRCTSMPTALFSPLR